MCYIDTTILHDLSQINRDAMKSNGVQLPINCISYFFTVKLHDVTHAQYEHLSDSLRNLQLCSKGSL
jgi:hypothetical protein